MRVTRMGRQDILSGMLLKNDFSKKPVNLAMQTSPCLDDFSEERVPMMLDSLFGILGPGSEYGALLRHASSHAVNQPDHD